MSEDKKPIYRDDSRENFDVDFSGSRGSINSTLRDYGRDEDNSETNEDEIIHLSLDKEESSERAERLTGLKAYIRSTFQWFPHTASATEKAICTTMQVLIVGILVCCYSFDMGAFNNRSLVKEEMDETVTAAKNIIWSVRFLELNVLGVLYFRKRHLEEMLSKVILTERYWKKTQKTIRKAILAVIVCEVIFPVFLKAVQMNLSTQKVASFNMV